MQDESNSRAGQQINMSIVGPVRCIAIAMLSSELSHIMRAVATNERQGGPLPFAPPPLLAEKNVTSASNTVMIGQAPNK